MAIDLSFCMILQRIDCRCSSQDFFILLYFLQPDYSRPVNLMQERHILPAEGVETVLPNLPNEFKKANCSPECVHSFSYCLFVAIKLGDVQVRMEIVIF